MSNHVLKIALMIDGANLWATTKTLGFDIDYKMLLNAFNERYGGYLVRALYYTAIREDADGHISIQKLVDFLDYNGYSVIQKDAREFTNAQGFRKIKGNMDIEIAVDALGLAPHIDHLILFSGDGDFCSLVKAVQGQGVRVTIVSSRQTNPPMVADILRKQADEFVDIADIKGIRRRD